MTSREPLPAWMMTFAGQPLVIVEPSDSVKQRMKWKVSQWERVGPLFSDGPKGKANAEELADKEKSSGWYFVRVLRIYIPERKYHRWTVWRTEFMGKNRVDTIRGKRTYRLPPGAG